MTRRRRHGSGSSDSFSRLYEIGGAEMALRYQQLLDEARARDETPAEPAPAPLPAPSTPPATPDPADLFRQLRGEFERARPSLAPDAGAGIDDFLGRLGKLVERGSGTRSLDEMLGQRHELDGLMREFLPRVANPTLPGPGAAPGSRAARLLARVQALKIFVGQAGTQRSAGAGAADVSFDLFARIARLSSRLNQAGDDEAAVQRIERDELRGLAIEVAEFARRRHVLLAQPVWGCSNLAPQPNHVFFAGPETTRQRLAEVAGRRALVLAHGAPVGADHASQRWHDLRRASLAVFDLADLHPQVFYELGIALTLGTPLLLLAPEGTRLPFDVAQNVRLYGGPSGLARLIGDELDAALYELQVPPSPESSLAATLAHAEALAARRELPFAALARDRLRAAGDDAARFVAALKTLNGMLGADEHEIVLSRWPGAYPAALARRWFAVLPFRPGPDRAHDVLRRTVGRLDPFIEAVRGDFAEGQQIVRSIWDEICRANLVTVDLTDLNPNVCLELGIAHTLGRPTVLIAQEGTERLLPARLPAVAKWRCHTYAAHAPVFGAPLQTALAAALGAPLSRRP